MLFLCLPCNRPVADLRVTLSHPSRNSARPPWTAIDVLWAPLSATNPHFKPNNKRQNWKKKYYRPCDVFPIYSLFLPAWNSVSIEKRGGPPWAVAVFPPSSRRRRRWCAPWNTNTHTHTTHTSHRLFKHADLIDPSVPINESTRTWEPIRSGRRSITDVLHIYIVDNHASCVLLRNRCYL